MKTFSRFLPVGVIVLIMIITPGCGTDQVTAPDQNQLADMAQPNPGNGNANPRVLPPQANPYGKSYAEWSVAYWQWLLSATVPESPVLDTTGENIDYGQSGPVWFLARTFGGVANRTGVVPPGKALFIDVAGWIGSPFIGDPETEPELRELLAGAVEATQNVWLEVDGKRLGGIDDYRVLSPDLFSFWLPDDSVLALFGFPLTMGTYFPAASDGIYVMLAPLPAGPHTIQIHAEFPAPFGVSDVTVNLMVGDRIQPM